MTDLFNLVVAACSRRFGEAFESNNKKSSLKGSQ